MWPTVAALAALGVLLALGTWQLERREWKENLLAKIASRVGADPVPLAQAYARAQAGEDVEYTHVAVRGRFHHDKERYLYSPAPAGLAWHVYTPLEFGPGRIIWVNRGLVPDDRKAPSSRLQGQVGGEVEIHGLMRSPPARSLFTPQNNPKDNLWYRADLAAMTRSAFEEGAIQAEPYIVEADAEPPPPGGLPKGGVTRLALPNRHLEYALTWYGLAATLIGVYLAFAAARLRALPQT